MSAVKRIAKLGSVLIPAVAFVWACGFDDTLREYLSARFWLPFAKRGELFEKPNVRRISEPFAGMTAAAQGGPLTKVRVAYQSIGQPEPYGAQVSAFDPAAVRRPVTDARADHSLTRQEREEVDLIDAKIDMRAGEPNNSELLESAKKKLEAFLKTARTPAFLSEARGWLAHVHYLMGDQAAAGKIYLDELNRAGSNLSRETLLNSLRMTYGYDGGPQLRAHLEEYFDTPEHAAFAIQLVTNPHWNRGMWADGHEESPQTPDTLVNDLIEKHTELLRSNRGANTLALLAMRAALRGGDPPGARKIAEAVPADAPIRTEPDFLWMLGSVLFLSRDFADAEQPLLALFRSPRASENQKAAAAYGLCGVYFKTGNVIERVRFALWLHTQVRKKDRYLSHESWITDQTVYWAISGWDLNMLLDAEAPTEALAAFVAQNPNLEDIRLVQYSLAVRLSRESRYADAADIYESIHAIRRAPRLRRLAGLDREANRTDLTDRQKLEARYAEAEFINANSTGIYFNDALWHGLQRYAIQAADETGLTRAERQTLMAAERKLKDDQEERWRAYLILRDVARDAGKTELRRKAALLGMSCLRRISDRFGREEEIRSGQTELWKLSRASGG